MRDDELGSVITALGQRNAYDDEHSPAPLVARLVARLVAVISACAICSSSRRFASYARSASAVAASAGHGPIRGRPLVSGEPPVIASCHIDVTKPS